MIATLYYFSIFLTVILCLFMLIVIIHMIDEAIEERLDKEAERKICKCETCCYAKKGKCTIAYERDCKENDYLFWIPKEEK